jgi:hypothetical protein
MILPISIECLSIRFSKHCKNVSATTLEMGEPMAILRSGLKYLLSYWKQFWFRVTFSNVIQWSVVWFPISLWVIQILVISIIS